MTIKQEARNKVEGDNRKQKNKKNNTNKKEQKRDENWKKMPPKEGESHEKKIKGHLATWRWCKHHMVWGNHREELCQLGNKHTNQQTHGLNQVAAQAALATVLNPKWQALMTNMARNMADE